jgi:hypothetical protein
MKSIITIIIMLAAFVLPSYAITGTLDTVPSDTFKIVEVEGKMYKLQGQTLIPLTIEEEPKAPMQQCVGAFLLFGLTFVIIV